MAAKKSMKKNGTKKKITKKKESRTVSPDGSAVRDTLEIAVLDAVRAALGTEPAKL